MRAQFVGRLDRDAATIALELLHIGKDQAPSLRLPLTAFARSQRAASACR